MILVAEDNLKNQKLIKDLLEANGYKLIMVSNGEEAVKKFKENVSSIKLVILDYDMPLMDGVDACKNIRGTEPDIDIPVIFCSASNPKGEMVELLKSDNTHFIPKPIDTRAFLAKVKELYPAVC